MRVTFSINLAKLERSSELSLAGTWSHRRLKLELKLFTAELFQKCFAYQIESLHLGMEHGGTVACGMVVWWLGAALKRLRFNLIRACQAN